MPHDRTRPRGYPGESSVKCETLSDRQVCAVLPGVRAHQPGGVAARRQGAALGPLVRPDRRFCGDPLPRRLRFPEPHPQHLLLPGVPGGQRVRSVAHTPQGDGQAVVALRTERPGPGGDLVQHLPFRRFQQPLLPGVLLRGGGVRLRVHRSPAGPALDHARGGHLLGAELCGGAGAGPVRQGGAAPLLPGGGPVRRLRRGRHHRRPGAGKQAKGAGAGAGTATPAHRDLADHPTTPPPSGPT